MMDEEKPNIVAESLSSAYSRGNAKASEPQQFSKQRSIAETPQFLRDTTVSGRYSRHGLSPSQQKPI